MKILLLLILFNLYVAAMDYNSCTTTSKNINNVRDAIHSLTCENKDTIVPLLASQENSNPPPWHKQSEKIEKLDQKVLKTYTKKAGGITQPFKTWFGILNYLHDTKKSKNFFCPFCKKDFTRATAAGACFLRHFDSKIFSCDSCKTYLGSYLKYAKHTKCPEPCSENQPQQTPFVLMPAVADEPFLRDIINQKTRAITCCGNSLGNWITALNHSSYMHKVGRSYQCNSCFNKYLTNTQALECYVCHCDESIFACPICNKAYITRETLLHHACNPEKILSNQTSHGHALPPTISLTHDRIYSSHQSEIGLPRHTDQDDSYTTGQTSYTDFMSYNGSFPDCQQSYHGIMPLHNQHHRPDFYVWPYNSQAQPLVEPHSVGLHTPVPHGTDCFAHEQSLQGTSDNGTPNILQPYVIIQPNYDFHEYDTIKPWN